MNFCPNCGSPVAPGHNFCRNCGQGVREDLTIDRARQPEAPLRGLGRNVLVYLTTEGLRGVRICRPLLLYLAVVVPLFILMTVYDVFQTGVITVYITIWVATSALLYDELRWRGLRWLGPTPPAEAKSWTIPWRSVRMADWNGRTLWFTATDPRRKLSVTFDKEDARSVESTLASQGVRYSWRPPRLPPTLTRFWTLVLLLFVVGQVILVLAATLPFFPGEEQTYLTILDNTKSSITGTTFIGEFRALFLNNIQVALGGAMPFFGTLTYGATSYNTGRVLQVIAATNTPQPVPPYLALVSLYLLPHTWVEESAYPIATIAGMFALTKWRSVAPSEFGRSRNWGSTKLIMALGGAAAILVAAGFIETLTSYLGDGILILWVPMAALYYAWVRNHKQDPKLSSA